VNNIVSFFDKLSESFLKLGSCCPRYSEYQLLFTDSTRLQNALCSFYAVIVNFCRKAILALRNPGRSIFPTPFNPADLFVCPLGITLAKALWRPFESEFGLFENELREQSKVVREEIKLAGEQAAGKEREAAVKHRDSSLRFHNEVRHVTKQEQERWLQRGQQRARKWTLHTNNSP
jgi:hypothetical protein